MNWTDDELKQIGGATELQLASKRKDGSLRKPVTIWVVAIGRNLYVRAVGGPTSKWYLHAQEMNKGHIDAGGIGKDVEFSKASDKEMDAIDAAYEAKYKIYPKSIVGSTVTLQARSATIKLVPAN